MKPTSFAFFLFFVSIWLGMNALQAQAPSTGLATYYADKYHGKPTASGEPYDKFKYTAAHRTFPFGTLVKVTRQDNGVSVVVRINDRGPFSQGRIIDVSRVAAESLDLINSGETQVRIEVVSGVNAGPVGRTAQQPAPTPGFPQPTQTPTSSSSPTTNYDPDNRDLSSLPLRNFGGVPAGQPEAAPRPGTSGSSSTDGNTSSTASHPVVADAERYTPAFFQFVAFKRDVSGYGIQVGAYFSFYRLMEAMDQLSEKGIQNTILHSAMKDGQPVFRILVGPFDNQEDAKATLRTLKSKGVEGLVVALQELR